MLGGARRDLHLAVEGLATRDVSGQDRLLAPAAVGLADALPIRGGVADRRDRRVVGGKLLAECPVLDAANVFLLLVPGLREDLRPVEAELARHHVVARHHRDGGEPDGESEERLHVLPEHAPERGPAHSLPEVA